MRSKEYGNKIEVGDIVRTSRWEEPVTKEVSDQGTAPNSKNDSMAPLLMELAAQAHQGGDAKTATQYASLALLEGDHIKANSAGRDADGLPTGKGEPLYPLTVRDKANIMKCIKKNDLPRAIEIIQKITLSAYNEQKEVESELMKSLMVTGVVTQIIDNDKIMVHIVGVEGSAPYDHEDVLCSRRSARLIDDHTIHAEADSKELLVYITNKVRGATKAATTTPPTES